MKWTVLTLVMLITTSFAIGEEAETNTANEDPSKNDYYANYSEMENTLHTCAIPSNKMFIRVATAGHQPSSDFDRFCYYQAWNNVLSRYLCQYYNFLVENYYGQYCSDPNRQPMDTTPQYQLMRDTPHAPCKKLVETVMQKVPPGVNKPVFASIDECEAVCQQSLFCTNLAYLMSIFQPNVPGGGGEVPQDGSPSGDGEGGKDSGDSPPGVTQGEGEGQEENNIPEEGTGEHKSGDGLEDDKNDNSDNGVEGVNDEAEVKDGNAFNGIHLDNNIPPINNQEDESNGLPPPADLSHAQDGVPGVESNGLPPPGDESPAQDGVPGGDSEEPLTFNDDDTGKPDEDNLQNEGTEENEENKAGEGEGDSSFQSTTPVGKSSTPAGNFRTYDFEDKDGQIIFDHEDISSSESDAGDMQLLDDSSDDEASKKDFYEADGLENAGEFDGQDNGDGNQQIPNVENQQQDIPKNQNAFKGEIHHLEEEEASSHFLAYSLTAIILIMVTYILYHNKQKIVAIIIEGRNAPNGKRRRYNQNVYTTVNEMA